MELLITFAAVVLFVYSPPWRKFVLITAAVVSVVVGSLCAAAYYDSHRRLTVDEVLGPDISDLPPPPSKTTKDEYSEFADAPKH